MNNSKLLLLTAGTILLVLITIFAVSRNEDETQSTSTEIPASLIPGLEEKLDSVATIQINTGTPEQTITLSKQGETWRLKQQDDYFVDTKKVNDFLLGFRTFKPLEQKTGNPERYAELGVQDPDGKDATTGEIVLKDSANTEIANLILGNQATSIAGQNRRYVRVPSNKNAWLVQTNATLNSSQTYWLNLQVLDVPVADFTALKVDQWTGEVLHADKPTTDSVWVLQELPEGKELANARDLENLPRTFQRLNLEQVRKATTEFTDSLTSQTVVTATTFNGLELTANLHNEPATSHWWATVSARYNSDARNEPAANKTAEETTELASTLNERLDGWLYQLPSWKVENLLKPLDSYIKKPEAENAQQEQATPQFKGLPEGMTLTPEMLQQLQQQQAN